MCITRPAFAHMALPFPTPDVLAACPALHECGSTSTEVYCNFSEPGQYSFLFACQSWNARLTPLSFLPDRMIKRRPDRLQHAERFCLLVALLCPSVCCLRRADRFCLLCLRRAGRFCLLVALLCPSVCCLRRACWSAACWCCLRRAASAV